MGACQSSPVDAEAGKEEQEQDRKIQADMDKAQAEEQQKVKLLLLGAGESGKSTVFKQMRKIYGNPITSDDRDHLKKLCYINMIQTVTILHKNLAKYSLLDEFKAKASLDGLRAIRDESMLSAADAQNLKSVWMDDAIQKLWKRRSALPVSESVQFFLDRIDEVCRPDYEMSDNDLLRVRVRTVGITSETFLISGVSFNIYDVGGQRNERRKWIHCFEGVTAVIFVAALSEYNQLLFEDSKMNRMIEAIQLFDEVCNNQFLQHSTMILFLNKRDLFEQKIQTISIRSVPEFEDYDGPEVGDFNAGSEYFLRKFLAMNKNPAREIYFHITCAMDVENIRLVFDAAKETILKWNLKTSGF